MSTAKLGPNAGNPRLSKTTLTYLLVALAIVPSAATIGLRLMTPGVKEGQLPVTYRLLGMAGPDYYQLPAETRPPLDDPRLQITNTGDGPLTQLNVILNYSHEIRDPHLVLAPNQSVVYRLKRFYNRAGIPFVPELSPIKHLRIFAKQDDLSRASLHVPVTPADYGPATEEPSDEGPGTRGEGEDAGEGDANPAEQPATRGDAGARPPADSPSVPPATINAG
jgi:hypothetical protein